MGRMYTTQTAAVAVTTAVDLWEILAATAKPIRIHGWSIAQTTDLGDAQEEVLRLIEVRGVGSVTSGSGGSSPTVHPIDDNDAAVGATVEANNTTRMATGTGTLETLSERGWNIRIPLEMIYTPEMRPRVNPGDRWTLAIGAAPADSVTISTSITFEEI